MSRWRATRVIVSAAPPALFVECASVSDLALTLDVLAEEDVAWSIVGKGSNLLVSDGGYDGAVIVLTEEFANVDFGGFDEREVLELPAAQKVHVTVGAGRSPCAPRPARVWLWAFGARGHGGHSRLVRRCAVHECWFAR